MENGRMTVECGYRKTEGTEDRSKPIQKPVTLPSSYATLRDLASAYSQNRNRTCYAALGLCVQMRPPLGLVYGGNVLEYGGKVMDALHERGADLAQTDSAGYQCWLHCVNAFLPTEEEVEETADFSSQTEDAATSSPATSD